MADRRPNDPGFDSGAFCVMKKLILCALLFGCSRAHHITEGDYGPIGITDPAPPKTPEDKPRCEPRVKVVLLSGQSNMERLARYALPELELEYVRIHGTTRFEFINCAEGGTMSWHWVPGGGGFENCVAIARGRGVTDVLHWQGESDAYNQATGWDIRFRETVSGFRARIGVERIVFAQIGRATGDWLRGWAEIQKEQASVCLPGVTMIRTADLTHVDQLEDEVHVSPGDLKRIARRFARAMR